MDIHVHGKPRHQYRLNGCQQAKDDGLQFLSMEEKECILFFEETIDSLEEGLDDTKRLSTLRTASSRGLQTSSGPQLSPGLPAKVSPNLMANDIIDLVYSPSNFTMPDFQNPAVTPEPHYETLPKKNLRAGVPTITTSFDEHEENDHQPPPGSVPTPVVIASKISEYQGTGGITPSQLLGHRRSLESKRDPALSARHPRLPSKINVTQGTRETSPHSLATAAIGIHERRSQILANLPAGSNPLEGGEPACMRNVPTRSVSFKDNEFEKSRMEALSKLGLMGGKTSNLTASSLITKGSSSPISPIGSSPTPYNSSAYKGGISPTSLISSLNKGGSSPTSFNSSAYKNSSSPVSLISSLNKGSSSHSSSNTNAYKGSGSPTFPISGPNKVSTSAILARTSANKVSVNTQANLSNNTPSISGFSSSYEPKPKSEVSSNNFNYYGGKSAAIMPVTKDNTAPDKQERRSSIPPSSAEVKQTDFNSYGGKSVVLNPTKSDKAESVPSASANAYEPIETHFNSYGGRSRFMNPLLNTDIPDGVDFAQSHSPTHAVSPTAHHYDPTSPTLSHPPRITHSSDQASYDTIPKVASPLQSDPVYQALVRTRPTTLTSPTAPRPQCPTGSPKPRPDPVPPEILGKPVPSFRTQGVTVQFSGKGTTGEARRDALRRLGLMKNTS